MKNKLKRIIDTIIPIASIVFLLLLWEVITDIFKIEKYILPSPLDIFKAFMNDFDVLSKHVNVTVYESIIGLIISIILSILFAVIIDFIPFIKKAVYPLLVISQTIPIIALAPLLVIWFGFGIIPRVIIVVLICFFPIEISILDGIFNVDKDLLNHFKLMGASKIKTFIYLKLPSGMINFFSGLKIAATYCIMGAVTSEWVGGDKGIGVYMIRAKNTYALDKMFASIFVTIFLSMALFFLVKKAEKVFMPWNNK